MTTTVGAIYEQGILRLTQALPFAEGKRVGVTVNVSELALSGGSPSDILDAIAALPLETQDEETASRDHDRILCGDIGAR